MDNRSESSANSGVSNSRLQKAIERNRARMRKRAEVISGTQTSAPRAVPVSRRLPGKPATTQVLKKSSLSERKSWSKSESDKSVEDRIAKLRQKRASRTSNTSRLSSARETTFWKSFTFKSILLGAPDRGFLSRWSVYLSWLGLCAFMLHISFGPRGLVEYYSRVSDQQTIKENIRRLDQENNDLVFEINQVENSRSYQRKVVRDYLGYISKDEHLIIFPESTIL